MRQSWAIVRAPWKAAPRVDGVDTRSGGFFLEMSELPSTYLPIEDIGETPDTPKKYEEAMVLFSKWH